MQEKQPKGIGSISKLISLVRGPVRKALSAVFHPIQTVKRLMHKDTTLPKTEPNKFYKEGKEEAPISQNPVTQEGF